jgi:hypothetical protein
VTPPIPQRAPPALAPTPGAERRYYARLAAIQRYFGQQMPRGGDPDANHALAFVEAPIGEVVEIDYNRIKRRAAAGTTYPVTADYPG